MRILLFEVPRHFLFHGKTRCTLRQTRTFVSFGTLFGLRAVLVKSVRLFWFKMYQSDKVAWLCRSRSSQWEPLKFVVDVFFFPCCDNETQNSPYNTILSEQRLSFSSFRNVYIYCVFYFKISDNGDFDLTAIGRQSVWGVPVFAFIGKCFAQGGYLGVNVGFTRAQRSAASYSLDENPAWMSIVTRIGTYDVNALVHKTLSNFRLKQVM